MFREHSGNVDPFLIQGLHRPFLCVKPNPRRPNKHVARFLVERQVAKFGGDVRDMMIKLSLELHGYISWRRSWSTLR
jgi:hypothetical protein